MDFLKSVDVWFLAIAVVVLAGFFVWASNYIFSSTISRLEKSIDKLAEALKEANVEMKDFIEELYDGRNDHEKRLTALETKCNLHHNGDDFHPTRQSGGRRHYDPPLPVGSELAHG